jgi:hypothetical protein
MFGANAHEILPGLWLGNRAASQDSAWLTEKGVKAVFFDETTTIQCLHPILYP